MKPTKNIYQKKSKISFLFFKKNRFLNIFITSLTWLVYNELKLILLFLFYLNPVLMVLKTVTHRRSATIKCRGAVKAFSTFCIKNDIWFKKIHNTTKKKTGPLSFKKGNG